MSIDIGHRALTYKTEEQIRPPPQGVPPSGRNDGEGGRWLGDIEIAMSTTPVRGGEVTSIGSVLGLDLYNKTTTSDARDAPTWGRERCIYNTRGTRSEVTPMLHARAPALLQVARAPHHLPRSV